MSKQNNFEFLETMKDREEEALKHLNEIPGFENARVVKSATWKEDYLEKVDVILENEEKPIKLQIKCRDRRALDHDDITLRVSKDRRYNEVTNSKADLIIEFILDTDSAMSDYKGKDLLAAKIFYLNKLRNSGYTLIPSKGRIWNSEKMNVSGNVIFLDVVPCKNSENSDIMTVPKSINNYIPDVYKEYKIS